MTSKQREQQVAITYLRGVVKPSDMVYTLLRHVSASGMTRHISLFVIGEDRKPISLDYYTSYACGYRRAKDGSLVVGGCGMDMGFSVVYNLAQALFNDGYTCTGEGKLGKYNGCYSNDHFNGDRDYTPHTHKDGGYALKQQWI